MACFVVLDDVSGPGLVSEMDVLWAARASQAGPLTAVILDIPLGL